MNDVPDGHKRCIPLLNDGLLPLLNLSYLGLYGLGLLLQLSGILLGLWQQQKQQQKQ
jgi:hypothetical protein